MPLTFGFGAHVCPGKQSATLAVEVFLHQLRILVPGAYQLPGPSVPSRAADLLFSGAQVRLAGDRRP